MLSCGFCDGRCVRTAWKVQLRMDTCRCQRSVVLWPLLYCRRRLSFEPLCWRSRGSTAAAAGSALAWAQSAQHRETVAPGSGRRLRPLRERMFASRDPSACSVVASVTTSQQRILPHRITSSHHLYLQLTYADHLGSRLFAAPLVRPPRTTRSSHFDLLCVSLPRQHDH
jgi:hypothetical protein